jgi:tRNA dimethylallyltransferase
MKKRMNKLIVITGPTASGKSDLGIELANKYDGEIISADSRQVYRDMDIGTGKVETQPAKQVSKLEHKLGKCLSGGVTHYLLNVSDPRKEIFNMHKFQKLANEAIDLIFSKNKLPFLVGGTMLYIDAVVKGYSSPGSKKDDLRKKLEGKSNGELLEILKEIDKKAYSRIDKNNRYRILRAIEVKKGTGKSFFESQGKKKPDFDYLKLVLSMDRDKLYDRIDRRVDIRVDKGMIDEVKRLNDSGLSYERMEKFGLEYRYISRYLQGELKKDKMIKILKNKTHGYARRQLTWWRNDESAIFIDNINEADREISKFI